MRKLKLYQPRQADCVVFRMYNPEQPNEYHSRRADIQLSKRTRTTSANAHPWVNCDGVSRGAAFGSIA